MARTITPLTATQIKQAKAQDKDYKMSDGGGLYLLVTKAGGKHWKLKYRINGKEKKLSLGAYPDITLQKARELREINRKIIADGIDPAAKKQLQKLQHKVEQIKKHNTFEAIAMQRLEKVQGEISKSHYKRTFGGFKNYVFPSIGNKPLDEIEAKDIIVILNGMMEKGIRNSAQKVYQSISKTFKYAVANNLSERNPCSDIDLIEVIGKAKEISYATITDSTGIKNLLISIKEYPGELSTRNALLMLAYTFVRPSNVRLALWSEIDLNAKQWVIPAKKMKTKDEFIVPLSDTLIELLKEIKLYSGDSPYLFPSTKSKTTPLSDGALLGAIRRMGYTKEEFTPHGFRAMFSTIAHEKSPFKYDVIETQLAHSVGNSVSQAYNRAKYLDERVKLMQWWSDYLDEVYNL